MKKLIVFIYLIAGVASSALKAQNKAEGINFFKGTWEEALVAAKNQQKLIFVDVYTDWCPPCKRMDAEIFPDQEVGAFYNNTFINFKLNAEKGAGIKLASQFAVKAYPTWLFVDETQNIVERGLDYMHADQFIALGKKAMVQKNVSGSLAELEKRYVNGERGIPFFKEYLAKRTSMKLDNAELLNSYVKLLPPAQLQQTDEIIFLTQNLGGTRSAALPIVMQNLKVLSKEQEEQVARQLYQNLFYNDFSNAIGSKRLDDAAQSLNEINTLVPMLSARQLTSLTNLKLHYYKAQKNATLLKEVGTEIAAPLMLVPDSVIAAKNRQVYNELMAPFLSGKEDSTKIPNFSQEAQMMKTSYSGELSSYLYRVSEAYLAVLEPHDKALHDSLIWAQRADRLYSNAYTKKLIEDIKKKISL